MNLGGTLSEFIVSLLITALAVHQATNVLLRSSLFAFIREKFELGEAIPYMPDRVYGFLQRLLGCPWCTSIQLSWILLLPFVTPESWHFMVVGRFMVYALAVSFVANILHVIFEHNGPS